MKTHEAFVRTPVSILHDNNLSDAAFRLYLEIFGLSGASKKGYCWATNRSLGKVLGKSPRSIIRALAELEKLGYIRKEETRNELTKQVTERRIYPLKNFSCPHEKDDTSPLTEVAHPSTQICHTPYDKSGTENRYNTNRYNTIDNTIDINNSFCSEKYEKVFDSIWIYYPSRIDKRDAFDAFLERVKEGVSIESLTKATKNYERYCIDNRTHPMSRIKGSDFYGSDRRYEDYVNYEPKPYERPISRLVDEDDELPF